MARVPRFMLVEASSTNHCTWRAHDHERVFERPGARAHFLALLARYKARHGVLVHAFCVMGTHPHVVCTASKGQEEFSRFWKVVNQCFARWYNARSQRRGQVVMDRTRSPRIQPEGSHQLTVMRYADLNPVRAGLVRSAKDWVWSSYRHYAFGERHPLIDDAPEYLALGRTGPARRAAYRALFEVPLSESLYRPRADLRNAPFIGDPQWVMTQLYRAGLVSPG